MNIVTIGDLSRQIRGVSYKKSEASSSPAPGYIPILRANNIVDGEVELTDLVYVPQERVSTVQYLQEGDVLIAASSGSLNIVGKAARVRQNYEMGFGAFCKVLRPNKRVDPAYFAHYFLTQRYRHTVSNLAAGANINNLRNEHLDNIQIPLPALSEQKRIAAILDKADALRAKRRAALAKLDTLLQATFLDMFGDPVTNPMGWPVGRIGDLASQVNYGSSRKASERGTFPILRMGNITYNGGWDLSDLKYIDLDETERQKHLVYRGQILFNRTNSKELVGKTAVFRETDPMVFAGYLVRMITNERADPEYVSAFMNTPHTKRYLQEKCRNIVGMANINAREFQAISIPIPPVNIQQRYGAFVQKILQEKGKSHTQLEIQDSLFQSLQQRAFKGEL